MSLRARLIAGMVVVSFVLVAVAFIIARTTESNLVDRVDQQLVQSATQVPPTGFETATGAGCAVSGQSSLVPTSLYVARIQDGVSSVLLCPNTNAGDSSVPKVSLERAYEAARSRDAFTASSTSGSGRYRVRALNTPDGVVVVGLSLRDVDATMGKLRWVLLAGIAI